MEFPIELLVLPSLTVLVVYGAYRMSAAGKSRKEKSEAMGEAGWWGVVFFVYGALDYALISMPAL